MFVFQYKRGLSLRIQNCKSDWFVTQLAAPDKFVEADEHESYLCFDMNTTAVVHSQLAVWVKWP
jgi:hypothetical protein